MFLKNAVFDIKKPIKFKPDNSVTVKFDFTDPATFEEALKGTTHIFLLRPPSLSNIKRDMTPFLEEAKKYGIEHIVFLSIIGVENNTIVPHYKIEKEILRLKFNYTFLRASFFMQNFNETHLEEIREDSMIFVPAGNAKVSFVDTRDIGEAVAELFLVPVMPNNSIKITGPDSLTFGDVAKELSELLNRKIRYKSPNIFEFWNYWRKKRPFFFIIIMFYLYWSTRKGAAKQISEDLEKIIKRRPRSITNYIHDYLNVWND